jgi:hypothetical protein
VLGWPVLQSIPPRACLVALNFCQPFLINRAITLSQEAITKHTTQVGYGLIGAYVFVYVGIAVSASLSILTTVSPLFTPPRYSLFSLRSLVIHLFLSTVSFTSFSLPIFLPPSPLPVFPSCIDTET